MEVIFPCPMISGLVVRPTPLDYLMSNFIFFNDVIVGMHTIISSYHTLLILNKMFESVKKRQSFSSKMETLYPMFHTFSISKGYEMCSNFEKAVEFAVPEMLWQVLMEKEFLALVKSQLLATEPSSLQESSSTSRVLSVVEANAIRYTARYIIRKLEQKYSKRRTKEATKCTAALSKMASKLRTDGSEEHTSSKWTKLIDRGGLHYVEDTVYDLFVTIECIVDEKLSHILNQGGKSIEVVKKENLSWVCDDDEVQSVWSMVSPHLIEEESVRRNLLTEITHQWITTRGDSKTFKLKETKIEAERRYKRETITSIGRN